MNLCTRLSPELPHRLARTTLTVGLGLLISATATACSSSNTSSANNNDAGAGDGSSGTCSVDGTWKSSKTNYSLPDGATPTTFCTKLATSLNNSATESLDTFDVSGNSVTIKNSKGDAVADGTLDTSSCEVSAAATNGMTAKDSAGANVDLTIKLNAKYVFWG